MIDAVAKGREATVAGQPYRILEIQDRKIILEKLKRGVMDKPAADVFDLREAAPIYVRDGHHLLACVVSEVGEAGPYVTVEFVPRFVVPEEG